MITHVLFPCHIYCGKNSAHIGINCRDALHVGDDCIDDIHIHLPTDITIEAVDHKTIRFVPFPGIEFSPLFHQVDSRSG